MSRLYNKVWLSPDIVQKDTYCGKHKNRSPSMGDRLKLRQTFDSDAVDSPCLPESEKWTAKVASKRDCSVVCYGSEQWRQKCMAPHEVKQKTNSFNFF